MPTLNSKANLLYFSCTNHLFFFKYNKYYDGFREVGIKNNEIRVKHFPK